VYANWITRETAKVLAIAKFHRDVSGRTNIVFTSQVLKTVIFSSCKKES